MKLVPFLVLVSRNKTGYIWIIIFCIIMQSLFINSLKNIDKFTVTKLFADRDKIKQPDA
jgi:hypothetical protein